MIREAVPPIPSARSVPVKRHAAANLPWIEVRPGLPYFITQEGAAWTPIGHNDSIAWQELKGLYARRDLPGVEAHFADLARHGVTCIRLMLECAQSRHRYLERPAGVFVPAMVRLWDDLFAIAERTGIRLLLTPYDTFWFWNHFNRHPYAGHRGGPLTHPSRALLDPGMRDAIKGRLTFAAERWGGSGALFAWDLWNEIHPAHADNSAAPFNAFIADLSQHLRAVERRAHGRAHPQTVSLFGPELLWRAHMPLPEPIFRHPDLDFATIHIYQEGAIDFPLNTVDAAVATGRIVRDALAQIVDGRPFLDTEHGPIHTFKDHRITLPEPFDDEYFRHMQWAHMASGGAGGGMRWPNRHPHRLTAGMREAQKRLADFLPLIDWARFRRRNLNDTLSVDHAAVAAFGCGDSEQAVVWLLRQDTLDAAGLCDRDAAAIAPVVTIPGLGDGSYQITGWDTVAGAPAGTLDAVSRDGRLLVRGLPFRTDLALAVRRL